MSDYIKDKTTTEEKMIIIENYAEQIEALKKENELLKSALDMYEGKSAPMLKDIRVEFEALKDREALYKRWTLVLSVLLKRVSEDLSQEAIRKHGIKEALNDVKDVLTD